MSGGVVIAQMFFVHISFVIELIITFVVSLTFLYKKTGVTAPDLRYLPLSVVL